MPPRPPPPDDAPHVLVVDDDARIRALLARYLADHGHRVTTAEDAAVARARLDVLAFDLAVVDRMMPGESGVDLVRSLRASGGPAAGLPVLMLTARAEVEDRLSGLEAGADDYLAKPFEPRELLLRLGSILRRSAPPPAPDADVVRFGPFAFHLARGDLRRGEEAVRLTEREQALLRALAEARGEPVAREALSAGEGEGGERAVDVQVNRLRRKVEQDAADPRWLLTARGVGYRLAVEP